MNKKVIILLLSSLLLVACGPRVIKGEAPFVRINGLTLNDQNRVTLELAVRNVNGIPLDLDQFSFRFHLEDSLVVDHNEQKMSNITANGTEMVRIAINSSATGISLLESLQLGDAASLPYDLEGELHSPEDGTLRFKHSGHLYPVPGRRGQFR